MRNDRINAAGVSARANAVTAATMEDTPVSINVLANDSNPSDGSLTLTGVTQGAHGAGAITPTATSEVHVSSGQEINAGSVLAYEWNQPCTIMAGIDVAQNPSEAAVIFTNVNAAPYPGYELWIDPSGHLRVRIISNFLTGNYIDVESSFVVTNGNWDEVASSYNGSGLASGVKIYVDGVLDTHTTTLENSLSGSIVSSTQGPLIIGNQTGYEGSYALNGSIDQFSISNDVRSQAYLAQYSSADAAPPVDANTALAYNFSEGSGTILHDLSSNGYSATLSSSSMWTKGLSAPGEVTYTPQAGFTGTDSFTYTDNNGAGVATGQVTVTVNPSPPVANAVTAATTEDTPVSINVLANDGNPSGGSLTLTGVTQGAHGAVAITATSAVHVSSGQEINAGSVLAYEWNQPWTIMAGVDVAQNPASAAVIASDLVGSGSAHPGYQLWIDPSGHLDLRLVNNFSTGTYIEVQSSFVVTNGNWDEVAVSYNGSGSASGIKFYLDGAQDTAPTILHNSLSGSIVSSGPLIIGNQAGYEGSYALNGSIDQFSISNDVRSQAYLAQYSSADAAPPVDANTALAYNFSEGSGTILHDLSSNGYSATLSSSSMWTKGPSAPGEVTYTPQAGFTGTDTFTYTDSNGAGAATGQVTVTVNSSPPVVGLSTHHSHDFLMV